MKKPFQVGDRVHCYGQNEGGNFDCPTIEGDTGTVVSIDQVGWISVKLDQDYGGHHIFHPKQIRRLVKKPPLREWWLCPTSVPGELKAYMCRQIRISDGKPHEGQIHVREVRAD